jgi:hypothetical protein
MIVRFDIGVIIVSDEIVIDGLTVDDDDGENQAQADQIFRLCDSGKPTIKFHRHFVE